MAASAAAARWDAVVSKAGPCGQESMPHHRVAVSAPTPQDADTAATVQLTFHGGASAFREAPPPGRYGVRCRSRYSRSPQASCLRGSALFYSAVSQCPRVGACDLRRSEALRARRGRGPVALGIPGPRDSAPARDHLPLTRGQMGLVVEEETLRPAVSEGLRDTVQITGGHGVSAAGRAARVHPENHPAGAARCGRSAVHSTAHRPPHPNRRPP